MTTIRIKELSEHVGECVSMRGFVYALRIQSGISFLILRDVTGTVQTVITKSNATVFDFVKTLASESCVEITGIVKNEPKAHGGIEINVSGITLISPSAAELPIPVYEKGGETTLAARMQHRFLDIRKPKNTLIMKLSATFDRCYREFLEQKGFFEIHSPKIMPTPSESSSDLFEVKYFDRPAFLAQSPQLYKQMAIASGLERVFEIGPIFRAEKSFTTRHATECTSYDMEMAYIESHEELMALEEELFVFFIKRVKEWYGSEIKELYGIDIIIPTTPFPKITMKEAKSLLKSVDPKGDLSAEEEKELGEHFAAQGHDFVFVTDFPIGVRPFYHKRYTDKPCTKSADLLYKGLEITTLAQREEKYDILLEQLKSKGYGQKDIQWYLDFFKYGMPPHGGWGIGGARVIMKLLNLESIRDAMFIYRGVNHIAP